MIPNLDQVNRELARRHLLDFTLWTKPNYKVNWHHELLCKKLDDFVDGKISRLMVFMPPRHGKSELGSRRLPAFILGKNPDAEIISCSYSADLASRMNRDVQRIIDSNEYQSLFPETTLKFKGSKVDSKSSYVRNAEMFEIVGHRGSYRAAGVGGGITGMGAKYAIIDDPIKNMDDANSPRIRDSIWDWYTSTLYTRLEGDIDNDDKKGHDANILVILTRWHDDDLAGHLLARAKSDPAADQWEILELPAIKEHNNNPDDIREIGETLWPAKYPIERMTKIKASVGSRVWASLYQQNPTPGEGTIFKGKDIRFYFELPKTRPDSKLISCDLAFKDTTTSDFVVMSVYGKWGSQVYLIDKIRKRMDFPKTLEEFELLVNKHPDAPIKLVEEKANGAALISMLKKKIPGIVPVIPKESKIARAHAVSPFYEAGNILYPHESIAPWIGDHIVEMTGFPFFKNDDSVDAETQAVNRLLMGMADEWTSEDETNYNENETMIDIQQMEW